MTYTYNDRAILKPGIGGSTAIIHRPAGMFDFLWKTYAASVVDALNSKGSTSALELGEAIHKAMLGDAKESPSMKLVDILAREIKVWPKGCLYISHDQSVGVFASLESGGNIKLKVGDHYIADTPRQVVTRSEWQAAVDALNAPKVADGNERLNMRLGAMIDMGWIKPVSFWPLWPRQTYGFELAPTLRSLEPKAEKPSSRKDCPEFLKSRIAELEAQNIELVKQSWLPNKDAAASRDRIKDLESQLEQLSADNESLSDIVVQLDDNAIQVLMRARDGDGLYFTSKEGQKVSVLRSGS